MARLGSIPNTIVCAGAIALFTAPAAPPSFASAPPRRCDAHRAYLKNQSTLVFRTLTNRDDGAGNPLTAYYVCARPNGVAHLVGFDAQPDVYSSNQRLIELRLAGRYVAGSFETGAGDSEICNKYAQPRCPTPNVFVRVLDARTGRRVEFPADSPSGSRQRVLPLAVSSAGAVAWLVSDGDQTRLYATRLAPASARRLRGTPMLVDSGNIAARSLRLDGLTLHWTKLGQALTARIPPP